MGTINMVKELKEIHPEHIIYVKIGQFYKAYGKDAVISSYIFGYKIKKSTENIPEIGFPLVALNKVMSKLEQKKIDYIVVDRRNNYDVDYRSDNENLNKYNEIYKEAHKYINIEIRIENIAETLKSRIKDDDIKEKIRKIEEILDEN